MRLLLLFIFGTTLALGNDNDKCVPQCDEEDFCIDHYDKTWMVWRPGSDEDWACQPKDNCPISDQVVPNTDDCFCNFAGLWSTDEPVICTATTGRICMPREELAASVCSHPTCGYDDGILANTGPCMCGGNRVGADGVMCDATTGLYCDRSTKSCSQTPTVCTNEGGGSPNKAGCGCGSAICVNTETAPKTVRLFLLNEITTSSGYTSYMYGWDDAAEARVEILFSDAEITLNSSSIKTVSRHTDTGAGWYHNTNSENGGWADIEIQPGGHIKFNNWDFKDFRNSELLQINWYPDYIRWKIEYDGETIYSGGWGSVRTFEYDRIGSGGFCYADGNKCSSSAISVCGHTDGTAANGANCACGTTDCTSETGRFCYADGNKCSSSAISVCGHGDGATANLAPCVCGTTECDATTGLVCAASSSTCSHAPVDCAGSFGACDANCEMTYTVQTAAAHGGTDCAYDNGEKAACTGDACVCANTNGTAANPANCACGTADCDATTGLFCYSDGHRCSTSAIAVCVTTDGTAANSANCACGWTDCDATPEHFTCAELLGEFETSCNRCTSGASTSTLPDPLAGGDSTYECVEVQTSYKASCGCDSEHSSNDASSLLKTTAHPFCDISGGRDGLGACNAIANCANTDGTVASDSQCKCGSTTCNPGQACSTASWDNSNCYAVQCQNTDGTVASEYECDCVSDDRPCAEGQSCLCGEEAYCNPKIDPWDYARRCSSTPIPDCATTGVNADRCVCGSLLCDAGRTCEEGSEACSAPPVDCDGECAGDESSAPPCVPKGFFDVNGVRRQQFNCLLFNYHSCELIGCSDNGQGQMCQNGLPFENYTQEQCETWNAVDSCSDNPYDGPYNYYWPSDRNTEVAYSFKRASGANGNPDVCTAIGCYWDWEAYACA